MAGGVSRTFKLRLSPAGMDVLIEAHCRVIRATRQLLPWGTTLHAALSHLDTLTPEEVVAGFPRVAAAGLAGAEIHFLGAPATLNEMAVRIAGRAVQGAPDRPGPTMLQVYLLALETLLTADVTQVRSAYYRISC